MTTTHEFDRYAQVVAALADASLIPPPPGGGPPGSMAWLRATVSRFAAGPTHARRRALIEADLAQLDPAALREAIAAGPEGEPRRLVVRTLAYALGIAEPDAVADAVVAVSKAYFGGDDPEAETAIGWLLPHVAGPDRTEIGDEAVANRIALLVQSCDATGGLVEAVQRGEGAGSVPERLARVIRENPPVRPLRRLATRSTRVAGVDIAAGDLVVLDLVAAARDTPPGSTLTFGAGVRPCPGEAQALALATGLLERDPAP